MKNLIITSVLLLHFGLCQAQGDTVTSDPTATEPTVDLIYILKCPELGRVRYDPKAKDIPPLPYYLDSLGCVMKREIYRDPAKRKSFGKTMKEAGDFFDKCAIIIGKIIEIIILRREKEKGEGNDP